MKTVDIIICVHNALEDVKKCIESVQNNTNCDYRMIIVDDGSADATRIYLENLDGDKGNIIRIRNEEGHGYTVAANMGIRESTAEYVVLLNSDTIVTRGWLEKLLSAFKADIELGIVGPIANVASWQSVPRITGLNGDWYYNELPQGISLQEYSDCIEKYINYDVVKVPLLNGFCLVVKRSVFDKIGMFDEKNFPKGYGEENDFNIRAGKAKIKLGIVTNCYIYHAQSKSYSDKTRLELCDYASKQLHSLYGKELIGALVAEMRYNYELLGVRSRVRFIEERKQYITAGKKLWAGKRILILLVCSSLSGGANVIIQEAEKMREMGVEVCFYNLYENREKFEQAYPEIDIPIVYGMNLRDFSQCVQYFDVVCATLNNTLQFFDFEGVKEVYYIQDYEPLFYEQNSKEYHIAFNSYTIRKDIVRVTKTKWNASMIQKNCNVSCNIIGPSVNIDLFRPKTKKQDGVVRICAMTRPSSARRSPEKTMRVLKHVKSIYGEKIKVFVFGCDAKKDKEFLSNTFCDFDYVNLGVLKREEMFHILQKSDVFVDFSTFQAMGLTTMEAMACGCAVVATNNGGTSEFGINEYNCLMIDTENDETCQNALMRLVEDSELRKFLAMNAIKDMCSFYPEKPAYLFLKAVFGEKADSKMGIKKNIPGNVFPDKLTQLLSTCDNIYIYGAGHFAKIYANFLLEENIDFKGFIVTSYEKNPEVLLSHTVFELSEINLVEMDKSKVGIIVAMMSSKGVEVASILNDIGYCNVYVHE